MDTTSILRKVKKDYTAIAEEFSNTREAPWPEFEQYKDFLKQAGEKPRVLDIGCGNGRLIKFMAGEKLDYLGVDNNKTLIALAKKRNPGFKFKIGDILKIPAKAQTFDFVFAVAVFHHIPSKKLQLKALNEIRRVLKKGGHLIVTVWDLRQQKYKKYIDKNSNSLIPWGKDKKVKRYYYAFGRTELRGVLALAGFKRIKHIKTPTNHNHSFIASK